MRNLNRFFTTLLLAVTLVLTGTASSVESAEVGDLLSFQADDVPANCERVTYSLGGQAWGLLMTPVDDSTWEGRFMVLPSQAGRTLHPMLTFHYRDGSVANRELDPIEITEKDAGLPGVISQSDSGELLCVFGTTVDASSVRAVTGEGERYTLQHESNFFRLPEQLESDAFTRIVAETIRGQRITLQLPSPRQSVALSPR